MSKMSCSHRAQGKHTISIGSSYSHSVALTTVGDRLETKWQTQWYLKWGWFPTPKEVTIYVNKKYDC